MRRRLPPRAAVAVPVVLFLGTVAPLYLLWLTPEMLNLALVTAGLVAWRRERPILSAVLLGLATYAKPTNLLLAIPLGVEPLAAQGLARGLRESARRGAGPGAIGLRGSGLTGALSGDGNSPGGGRTALFGPSPLAAPAATFDPPGYEAHTT